MTLSTPLSARLTDVLVANVADDQLRAVGKVFRAFAVAVNLLDQAVENPYAVAAAKKLFD